MPLPHHIAIPVRDLEQSVAFYALLGFTNVAHWERPEKQLRAVVLEEREQKLRLELVLHPDNASLTFANVPEAQHVGIVVHDLTGVLTTLKKAGIVPIIPLSQGITVKHYAFVRDPNGFPVELLEYA